MMKKKIDCFTPHQTDTIWTLSQSPILISGPVAVSEFATLTVEAGVRVVFTHANATIRVFGKKFVVEHSNNRYKILSRLFEYTGKITIGFLLQVIK